MAAPICRLQNSSQDPEMLYPMRFRGIQPLAHRFNAAAMGPHVAYRGRQRTLLA